MSPGVRRAALDLPPVERAELASELLASLPQPPRSEIDAAWDEEISRRVHAYERGELATYAFSEVRRRAFERMASGE